MSKKKKKRVEADGAGFGGSLGDLLRAEGLVAADAPVPAEATPIARPDAAPVWTRITRVRLQFTKKGRGGKAVTEISGLEPLGDTLPAVVKALRKRLGCGALIEEDLVIVQGDQRDRLTTWLRDQGVRDIK